MKHNDYPSGSNWLKWDIHTHTPLDHEWKNKPNNFHKVEVKKQFARDYITFAKKQELSLIAITDHNFCNNIEDLAIPYIMDEAKKENITILPGFEITAKDGSGIHLLVIFKEDTALEIIKEIVDRLFPPSTILVPKERNVPVSNKNIEEIYQEAYNHPKKPEFLIVFAHIDRSNGVLDKSTIRGTRRIEEWQKPFIEISQISSTAVFEKQGFYRNIKHDKNFEYYRKMTYLTASDCRQISIPKTEDNKERRFYLGEKFAWIKANPTFDGLKQIIHEPTERVKVQKVKPDFKLETNIIKRVRFISKTVSSQFSSNWVELNQNLNTIIGGKSSGKSLLLSLIAKTINPEIDISKYNELIKDCDFEVVWGDDTVYKLSEDKHYYDARSVKQLKRRRISYVAQLAIHRLIEENPDEYKSIILSFLKENETFKIFYENFERDTDSFKAKVENNLTDLFQYQSTLKRRKEELKNLGDKQAKQEELKRLKLNLAKLEDDQLSDEEKEEYDILQGQINNLKQIVENTKELSNAAKQYKQFSLNNINDLGNQIRKKHDEISMSVNEKNQAAISIFRDKILQNVNSFSQNINSIFKEIEDFDKIINETQSQVELKTSASKRFYEQTENKVLIQDHKQKIEKLEKDIKNILSAEKKAEIELEKSNKSMSEVLANYEALFNQYKLLKREIELRYKNLIPEDKLSLNLKIDFDEENFYRDFIELFDRRFSLSELSSYFQNNTYSFNLSSHFFMIRDVLKKLIDNGEKFNFKRKNEVEKAVKFLLSNYFNPLFKLRQDDEDIEDMSYGKKSLILLKLYLSLSKVESPIFIDQPEDNLDNRTIYSELKEFMRQKKVQRQIIIVTHNANLVVSTDAELVVVANQAGQNKRDNLKYKFEYITGALENSFTTLENQGILYKMGIKEHVCDVLEGGKDAFEERERKYGFKK